MDVVARRCRPPRSRELRRLVELPHRRGTVRDVHRVRGTEGVPGGRGRERGGDAHCRPHQCLRPHRERCDANDGVPADPARLVELPGGVIHVPPGRPVVRCHRCGTTVDGERAGVRAVCEHCSAYLHCCRNCDFYAPGVANDCREPTAERWRTRSRATSVTTSARRPRRTRRPTPLSRHARSSQASSRKRPTGRTSARARRAQRRTRLVGKIASDRRAPRSSCARSLDCRRWNVPWLPPVGEQSLMGDGQSRTAPDEGGPRS